MLAAQMYDTRNRGKIIWMFATSRPDLLEVDLKRQGRLDVHIPLFPPQNKEERNALFKMLAKKVKLDINYDELPELPENLEVAGNEMEGLLIRAKRIYELQGEDNKKSYKEILADIIKNFRPSMHTANLEYMDLIAVKECTDDNFLPEKYKKIKPAELEERIEKLKFQM